MKCENCNQEGFDALITLAGTGALHADGWCLDCVLKWSYAHRYIKISKPKIEYFCRVCNKTLYPQNGVTYVYQVKEVVNGDHQNYYFLCRDHGESFYSNPFSEKIRYTRQMHLQAIEKLEKEENYTK